MKNVIDIQNMLVSELFNHIDNLRSNASKLGYYNEITGDTSMLLARLLDSLLRINFEDWNSKKWIDDSLLSKVKVKNNNISIWGVMIWGMDEVTDQWTDPFYFEIQLNERELTFFKYHFLFCDLNQGEISYEEFAKHRQYWTEDYYSNSAWDVSEKDWNYIITEVI